MPKPGPAYHTIDTNCPHCGHKANAATCTHDDAAPNEGDVGICFKCGEWNVYGDDMQLRLPTDAELAEIAESKECQNASEAWRAFQGLRRSNGTPA
jgi:hypothetical protein